MHLRRLACKLRKNDSAFDTFYLPLDDLSELDEITRAMRVNTTVKEVSVYMEYLEDDWLGPEIWSMFRALGNLAKLERLIFDFIGSDGDELPLALLTAAIRPATKLISLELSCVHLTGGLDEVKHFAKALRGQPWKKIEVFGCCLDPDLRESTFLDPILNQIAAMDSVQEVIITALDFNFLGQLSGETLLRVLSESRSLKNVVVGEFRLDDEHIVPLSVALEENRNLTELSIGCELGPRGSEAMAKMLQCNKSLEILHLYLTTLEGGEKRQIAIAEALEGNHSLKRFSLFGSAGNITIKTQSHFAKMLERNFQLEELELQDEDDVIRPQIEMYLKLNRAGRGRLLQSEALYREDWVSVLFSLRDYTDCLFHMISLNPAVCNIGLVSTLSRGGKRKR